MTSAYEVYINLKRQLALSPEEQKVWNKLQQRKIEKKKQEKLKEFELKKQKKIEERKNKQIRKNKCIEIKKRNKELHHLFKDRSLVSELDIQFNKLVKKETDKILNSIIKISI